MTNSSDRLASLRCLLTLTFSCLLAAADTPEKRHQKLRLEQTDIMLESPLMRGRGATADEIRAWHQERASRLPHKQGESMDSSQAGMPARLRRILKTPEARREADEIRQIFQKNPLQPTQQKTSPLS
jgi:hypothetical protein